MDAKQLEIQVKNDLKKVGKSLARRLAQPTSTWNNKPDFVVEEPRMVGGDLVCRVRTDGVSEGSDEYFFLDEGTKVRRALMTRNFVPKTSVRSFSSGPGRGSVALIRPWIAQPGITAREWTEMAAAEYGPVIQSAIDKTLAGYKGKPTGTADRFGKYTP